MSHLNEDKTETPESPERRELLAKAGRYAGATSAAALVLLSTTKSVDAGGIFRSGGHRHKRKYRGKKYRKHWKGRNGS